VTDTSSKAERVTGRCDSCQRPFTYTAKADEPPRTLCGGRPCHARTHWGPDDWAGRARMATARQAAGRDLDRIDHEALARAKEAAA
jgi:hypothetical protein